MYKKPKFNIKQKPLTKEKVQVKKFRSWQTLQNMNFDTTFPLLSITGRLLVSLPFWNRITVGSCFDQDDVLISNLHNQQRNRSRIIKTMDCIVSRYKFINQWWTGATASHTNWKGRSKEINHSFTCCLALPFFRSTSWSLECLDILGGGGAV